MPRHVAFLRGLNLGRRRVKNDELCGCFEALGFDGVAAFLASGNVVFDAEGPAAALEARIEKGLRASLGYEVPAFVRTIAGIRTMLARDPFPGAPAGARIQIAMLRKRPAARARRSVLALATDDDRLAVHGRELFWLPRGNLSDSDLDLKRIEGAVGSATYRTRRTLERLAAKYGPG